MYVMLLYYTLTFLHFAMFFMILELLLASNVQKKELETLSLYNMLIKCSFSMFCLPSEFVVF